MVAIHSNGLERGPESSALSLFMASPLTIPIRASRSGNDLIEKGLFLQIYAVMSGHVPL